MNTYSTREVVERAGITYRQLDYWLRLDVLECASAGGNEPGSGRARRLTEREACIAAVVGKLASLGCNVRTLRGVAARLRPLEGWATRGLLFVRDDGSLASTPEGAGWVVDLAEFAFEEVAA